MRRVLMVLLTVAIGLAGCGSPGADSGDPTDAQGLPGEPAGAAEPAPSVAGVAVFGKAPAAKPSAKPSRRPSKAAARPAPSPSRRPVKVAGPPPPAPKPDPVTDRPCPYHEGTDASRSAVKSALVTAANMHVWSGQDVEAQAKAEEITVPIKLMKAVAWQESGWQSTIIACDGGIGTMQIMPDTEDWMNGRFGTSYDAHTLSGNTKIGAALLEWLIYYFGHFYFDDNFNLDTTGCDDATSPCLLNAVIASYNFGYGAVDVGDHIEIPNPQYVRNVRALMTECECLNF